jgi:hypothetical protein
MVTLVAGNGIGRWMLEGFITKSYLKMKCKQYTPKLKAKFFSNPINVWKLNRWMLK